MRSPFFDPVIDRYVKDRLIRECRVRGTGKETARATGYSHAYLASLMDDSRKVSEEFAAAVCKFWGIRSADLVRVAHESCGANVLASGQEKQSTHPELDEVLAFLRNTYPTGFLLQFEAAARTQADRPRMQWLIELHTQFFGWVQKQPVAAQHRFMMLLSTPVPAIPNLVPAPKGAGAARSSRRKEEKAK